MNKLDGTSTSGAGIIENSRKLLASPRHTFTLFGIVMILLVAGILNSSNKSGVSQAANPSQMIKVNLIMIAVLWYWAFFIYKGMQGYGRSILEFFELKSFTLGKLMGDCIYAVLAFVVIYACSHGVHTLLPDQGAPSSNPILSSKPAGLLGVAVWICLSISAGICEEIVFRGYLQRQLALMTGNVGIAILLQAVLFGIGHAYEGFGSVVAIVLHGLFLGILAKWRGNIRAGIIEHAGWDIIAGFGLLNANW
ncbi:CPBP family intramembrane glutamic endopeptidase [Undibacterium sp. TS12]|uniref:CPBP family intramembrane glutamic endopeptidase n=1 Tax=Undibacterium sp. TS12 TaxID=2908202 RepID=UPI001F4CF3B8|nr:CPBP family intramembrane glutamic endopeptidase [Undibacterium sp. TS12]MCH8620748.1 CPBP family intramembrane metalloprotease [Undibacterium sp. TS12]